MAKHDISDQTASTVTGLSEDQFARLLAAAQGNSGGGNDAIALLAATMERLVAAQNRSADATEKTITRSNATHPGKSSFSHKEGERDHPKNTLNAKTAFLGVPQFEDTLTPVEIDLFNAITSGRTAREGAWVATYTPSMNGGKSSLNVSIAITEGNLAATPTLVQILTELATGAKPQDVASLYETIAEMSAKLARLEQGQPEAVAV